MSMRCPVREVVRLYWLSRTRVAVDCRLCGSLLRLLLGHLSAQSLFLLAQLWRQGLAEVIGFEDLPDLDLRFAHHRIGATLPPVDRLFERRALPDPEAGDQLVGFGERPLGHFPVLAREPDAGALRTGLQALAGLHDA